MRADITFIGGVVIPAHRSPTRHEALAVRDGRVVALGEAALAADAAQVIDLDGGALMPGFGDGHAHPLQGGGELSQAPIRDCTSVAEVAEAVRRHAAAHPDAEWVTGGSYDPSLASGGIFDARWLDDAVPDRPVVLQASDHHCAWVNTAALRRAGIDVDPGSPTPDPPAGTIARRSDGSATGTLVEWSAMDLVLRHLPTPTVDQRVADLVLAGSEFAAAGITWVQEAALAPEHVAVYQRAAAEGLRVRANIALRAEPGMWPDQRAAFAAARASTADDAMVSARTVKMFADGVIEAGTAALLDPYDDAPHSCGLPVWDPAELAEAAAAFDADGFQLHLHAIGDAAIRTALDAIETAIRRNGSRRPGGADRRPVITHVQLVHPDDLPRFAQLGVIASFQPLWARLDACQMDLTQPRIGLQRSRLQYPFGSMLRSGARLAMASDWPVSSLRPLETAAVAVTRRNSVGEPAGGWLPDERLSEADVLSAYTAGTAVQAFEEEGWGGPVRGTPRGPDVGGRRPARHPRVGLAAAGRARDLAGRPAHPHRVWMSRRPCRNGPCSVKDAASAPSGGAHRHPFPRPTPMP